MIRLFISYRRGDAAHAAQRVRSCMQAKFGDDAVFIDREIPAGADWAAYLKARLQESTDVVVLVGDAFLRELRRGAARAGGEPDWLKFEIMTAIEQKKRLYPVLIGSLDMPGPSKLPEEIRQLAAQQAVFAREPAFDAAMAALAKSIAEEHGWIEPRVQATSAARPATIELGRAGTVTLLTLAGLVLTGFTGRVIEWLAGMPAGASAVATFWTGALFVLATTLWGLGPYLVFRAVAEVRAQAQLPIHNLSGLLTFVNLVLALLAGGTFLLLSTRADWALNLWQMKGPHGWAYYALQGGVLLLIVFATLAVAMLEPAVRRWREQWRGWGGAGLNGLAVGVMLAALWFAAALLDSLPSLAELDLPGELDAVPMVGYFMLAPALSLLVLAWDVAQALLGPRGRTWRSRVLLGLAVGLYLACTLGYFAHGPLRLFIAAG